ncbi:MAG TPA: serine/threonine-protein kinase [Thermoanaerobaculia bacterium]|nr:serine/threonine-protein kinase [Thermoanaerobaculia bacterium]
MTSDRWQQVKAVLEDVLEREEAERRAFLDAACQGDDELRREVESLLASEAEIGDFIETPVFRIHGEDAQPLAVGQRVGAYQVVREIGRGGMGSVYLAERADQEFDQRVALKLVRRGMDTDEIVRRFRSERQILAHLDHPNIAKLFDGGTAEDGRPYFVMEYVEGRPIDEYCDERKLPTRERLELFRSVCSAVHFAHQNLIVHRDLKPGNILVTADGTPKLLDFGIAKLLGPNQELLAFTRADVRPMTPEYASPEQVKGEAITTASDVYSLGVLLYHLLTGHSPYRPATRDPQSLAKAICEVDPPRPSSVIGRVGELKRPDGSVAGLTPESVSQARDGEVRSLRRHLAGDLDNIVLMAMQKDPQRRYASVDQLSNDIGRHLQGLPVIARKDTVGYRARKFVGRHKVGVAVAAVFLLLIVGFSVTVTVLLDRAVRERERAVRERERATAASEFLKDVFSSSDPKQAQGETIKARDLLDSGVKKINASLANQPELRAEMTESMGRVYRSLGLYKQARRLLKESLRVYRKTVAKDDLRIAYNLHNLAILLREMDDEAAAEPLIREALEIQRKQRDTHNLEYAVGLTNLGAYLEDQGQFDKAEALYEESLAIKKALKVDQEDIVTSINNLGKLYQTRGNYAAAERYYKESLAIRRKLAKGRPDEDVATGLNNLASLYEDLNKLDNAETLQREVVAIRRQLYAEPNVKLAVGLAGLGHIRQTRGDGVEAEKLYREALAIADQVDLPRDHTSRAIFLRNLAFALLSQGRMAEAEARVRDALAIFRKKQPDSWRLADAESVLGSCLAAQRRFQEAEPLLVKSYPLLKKDDGDGAKQAPVARKRIVDLYNAWGRPEKAASYLAP